MMTDRLPRRPDGHLLHPGYCPTGFGPDFPPLGHVGMSPLSVAFASATRDLGMMRTGLPPWSWAGDLPELEAWVADLRALVREGLQLEDVPA